MPGSAATAQVQPAKKIQPDTLFQLRFTDINGVGLVNRDEWFLIGASIPHGINEEVTRLDEGKAWANKLIGLGLNERVTLTQPEENVVYAIVLEIQ